MDRGLAWTIGGAALAFIALGVAFFSWAYFVTTGPNPNVVFASIIAVSALLFVIAGISGLRYVIVGDTADRSSQFRIGPFVLVLKLLFRMIAAIALLGAVEYFILSRPPRLLYPDEMQSMIDQLKKIKPPGRVQIVRNEDETCRALADQFSRIVLAAGWQEVSNPRAPEIQDDLDYLNRGLRIYRFNLDRPSLQFTAILYNLGVNYSRFDDYDLYNSDYFIVSISDGWF
ncbi:MAG: hypothetical protein ABSG46_05185 [Candidatus Binataceae bacterium]|jgi:hypothetical protein